VTTGFGKDTWCLDSLQPGKLASGIRVVMQNLYHMCITPQGTLRGLGESGDEGGDEDELSYGFDVMGYVGAVGDEVALRSLPLQLAAAFKKDDRVLTVTVEASISEDPSGLYTIELTPTVTLIGSEETFEFTIGVSALAIGLIGVSL